LALWPVTIRRTGVLDMLTPISDDGTTVDDQDLAVDEPAGGRGQEHRGSGNLTRLADAAQRAVAYAECKQRIVEAMIEAGDFTVFPDALRLAQKLSAMNVPLAVASSSKNADQMMRLIDVAPGQTLLDLFAVNVCGRDLARGKPDPEIFLIAAKELDVDPAGCLVVEDAPAGIEAARAGGMMALGIARLGDAALLRAFAEDRDIHQATAAEVLGVPLEAVDANQRRSAKAVNFGLIYGMSAFGLARQLGISRGDAQKYVDLYFERYPGVKRYMEETRRQARETGYVETLYGRRLYLPEIQSRNQALRQSAERSAINAPMQGTAADIIKRAMIDVDAWLTSSRLPARLIMQVHDELVLEVAEHDAAHVAGELRERMARAADLKVALKVDTGIGRNWDEAH